MRKDYLSLQIREESILILALMGGVPPETWPVMPYSSKI